jgi:hypothetical protein
MQKFAHLPIAGHAWQLSIGSPLQAEHDGRLRRVRLGGRLERLPSVHHRQRDLVALRRLQPPGEQILTEAKKVLARACPLV